jgi:hypothetical protein
MLMEMFFLGMEIVEMDLRRWKLDFWPQRKKNPDTHSPCGYGGHGGCACGGGACGQLVVSGGVGG